MAAAGTDMVRYVGASHRLYTPAYILEVFSRDNGRTWTELKRIVKSWEKDGNLHMRPAVSTFIDAERAGSTRGANPSIEMLAHPPEAEGDSASPTSR